MRIVTTGGEESMTQYPANIDLSTLDGSNGFRLHAGEKRFGRIEVVASAGDVNGDGFADLIAGAPDGFPYAPHSGAIYVIFGKASGFGTPFELSSLDGSNGFILSGAASQFNETGESVASAGDVNG